MSGVPVAGVTIWHCGADDVVTQSVWVIRDAAAVERLREQLGEPVCEVLLDGPAMAAVGQAGDAAGAVVMFADDT